MPEIKLSEVDKKGLAMGAKYVAPQWWHMIDVFKSYEEGKILPYQKRVGGVPMSPLEMDFGAIAPLMKEFITWVFLDNPTMASLVMDENHQHLIWAAVEYCTPTGVYKWIEKLDVTQDWAEKVNPLLAEHKFKEAYEVMGDFVKEKFDVELGLVKVARAQFFVEMEKLYIASKNGEDLPGWVPAAADFGKTIFTKDYINFYPVPYFFGLLRGLVVPMIKDWDADTVLPLLRKIMYPKLDVVITLSTAKSVAAFRFREDGEHIILESVNQDISDKLFDYDIKTVARRFRDKFRPDLVVSLGVSDDLKILLKTIMTKVPWDKGVYYLIGDFMSKSMGFLGTKFWIEWKEGWLNLENILSWTQQLTHYDITKLRFPLDLIIYGLKQGFSDTPIGLFVINNQGELLTPLLIDLSKDVPKLTTPAFDKAAEVFRRIKNPAEALKRVCQELSPEYGEIYPAICLNIDIIAPILIGSIDMVRGPLRANVFAMKTTARLNEILEQGIVFSQMRTSSALGGR